MSRRRIGLGLVALLLAARVTSAQTVVTPTSKLQWTEATSDLATAQSYLYKHYDDGAATGTIVWAVPKTSRNAHSSSYFETGGVAGWRTLRRPAAWRPASASIAASAHSSDVTPFHRQFV